MSATDPTISPWSVTSMVKVWAEVERSELVAVTVMVWLASVSKSSGAPGATETTPVLVSMTKRPPASSLSA